MSWSSPRTGRASLVRAAYSAISSLVTVGESTDSPAAATRTAGISSAASVSSTRNPAAPAQWVAQQGLEPARLRLLKCLADRPGRAAMPPARVSQQKQQGDPPRPDQGRAGRVFRRRPADGKRLSRATSRAGLD